MSDMAKKNKKKINVIDVVIILLVLALIGTAVYRIYSEISKNTSAKKSNIILTFECEVTYDSILKYAKDGDAVYLESDGTLLGYLHKADGATDALYAVADDTGSGSSEGGANKSVKLLGTLKLSSDAREAQNGGYYVINGNNITNGSTLNVYTETTVMKIVVKSIENSQEK